MIGTMGCVPARISKPRAVIASRKKRVLSSSRSRRSVLAPSISSTRSEPPTIDGASVFEKRYGRERCRSSSMIAARPLV